MTKQSDRDNHANQMNPNNEAYWESRGYDERPDDWEERIEEDTQQNENVVNIRANLDRFTAKAFFRQHRR